MGADENQYLYFFSTYAQSLAALVGLSSAFAIFHYQNLRIYSLEKAEKIHKLFRTPLFSQLLSDQEESALSNFVNDEQRAIYLEPIYARLRADQDGSTRAKLGEDLKKLNYVQDEFTDLNHTKSDMTRFRGFFIGTSAYGAILVVISLRVISQFGILGAFSEGLYNIASVAAFIYVMLLIGILRLTLKKPLTKI